MFKGISGYTHIAFCKCKYCQQHRKPYNIRHMQRIYGAFRKERHPYIKKRKKKEQKAGVPLPYLGPVAEYKTEMKQHCKPCPVIGV